MGFSFKNKDKLTNRYSEYYHLIIKKVRINRMKASKVFYVSTFLLYALAIVIGVFYDETPGLYQYLNDLANSFLVIIIFAIIFSALFVAFESKIQKGVGKTLLVMFTIATDSIVSLFTFFTFIKTTDNLAGSAIFGLIVLIFHLTSISFLLYAMGKNKPNVAGKVYEEKSVLGNVNKETNKEQVVPEKPLQTKPFDRPKKASEGAVYIARKGTRLENGDVLQADTIVLLGANNEITYTNKNGEQIKSRVPRDKLERYRP